MPVQAAQLVAVVKVDGVPQATVELQKMGGEVEKTHHGLVSSGAGMVKSLLGFGSQLGLTVMGVKGLAEGAIGLGSALLGPNAAMEQTTVGFETLLGAGKKTQDFMKELQHFAAVTPFEFPELATDAQHMLAFGFSAKEVIPNLTAIGDAMSAMGKGTADIDAVVRVFGQMKAAGKANAGDMMQLADQGIPAWKFLAEAMHKTVPEVQDLSQKGLIPANVAISAMTKGMEGMFKGGMDAQSKTFIGLLSTLKDNANAALRSFTGPLFDAAKKGLTELGNLAGSKQFQDFATNAGKSMGDAFKKIGEAIGPVTKQIQDAFKSFAPTAKGIKFGDIGKELLKAYPGIKQVADIIGKELSTDIHFALKCGKQISQWFQAEMLPVIKQAMPSFIALSKVLINDLAPALAKAWAKGQQIYRLFASDVIPVFEKVAPIVVKLAGFLADKLAQAIKFLTPYFNQAVDAIGKFAKEISDRVMPIINNFFDGLNKNMPTIKAIWNATWPVLASVLKGAWDIIVGVVKVAWAIVSGIIKIGLDILSGNWKQAWNDLLTMLGGIWDGIKTFLSGALRLIIQVILGKGQDVQDAVIKPFQQAYDFVTGLFGKLGGIINDTLSNIGKRINDLHIPGLPKFASGVENFSGGMAYVHAGEVITYLPPGSSVTPASKVSSMMSSQGKQPVQIIVNLAGHRVAHALLPDITQAIRYGVGGVL